MLRTRMADSHSSHRREQRTEYQHACRSSHLRRSDRREPRTARLPARRRPGCDHALDRGRLPATASLHSNSFRCPKTFSGPATVGRGQHRFNPLQALGRSSTSDGSTLTAADTHVVVDRSLPVSGHLRGPATMPGHRVGAWVRRRIRGGPVSGVMRESHHRDALVVVTFGARHFRPRWIVVSFPALASAQNLSECAGVHGRQLWPIVQAEMLHRLVCTQAIRRIPALVHRRVSRVALRWRSPRSTNGLRPAPCAVRGQP